MVTWCSSLSRVGGVNITPLPRHDVEVDGAHHVVQAVAAQHHRPLLRAVGHQPAGHAHGALVVEEQCGAGVERERRATGHKQRVVDQIRLIGCEMDTPPDSVAVQTHHVLSPGMCHHLLLHAIGLKLYQVADFHRRVLPHLIKIALHKHVDAVVAAHLHIMELGAFHTVHIQIEMSLVASARHLDGRDAQLLLAAVIDHKLLGGCRLRGNHRVKLHTVGRELQHVGRAGGEIVLDACGEQRRERHK